MEKIFGSNKTTMDVGPFLDRIANIDFNKYYTTKIRILCHFLMWTIFGSLLFLYYWIEFKMALKSSLILTVRMMINNTLVFYTFFYLLFPVIFKNKAMAVILLLISVPFCVYLWMVINYSQFSLLYASNLEVDDGPFKGVVKKFGGMPYFEALSFRYVLANSMIIINTMAPSFFVKILFDITRLFSHTIAFYKQKSDLEIENINIEKDFLKSQLNPHFLFNTLNNLYGLTIKKDDLAPEVILNLSDIMSYSLYESNSEKVPLEKELDFIRNYFQLEKMRYRGDKNIKLEITGQEEISGLYIAPLLTFTFVENAFKYGLKSNGEQFVNLNINIQNSIFYFKIENDFEKHVKENEYGGIGLENAKKRLQLLYPDKSELSFENTEERFCVILKIDLNR